MTAAASQLGLATDDNWGRNGKLTYSAQLLKSNQRVTNGSRDRVLIYSRALCLESLTHPIHSDAPPTPYVTHPLKTNAMKPISTSVKSQLLPKNKALWQTYFDCLR